MGTNSPNYFVVWLVTVGLASALLMAVILIVVFIRGLRGFSGVDIGGSWLEHITHVLQIFFPFFA